MNQMEQRSVIRFEKRGRELDAVARLTTYRWGVVGKPRRPQQFYCEGPRVNVREVTASLSEAG